MANNNDGVWRKNAAEQRKKMTIDNIIGKAQRIFILFTLLLLSFVLNQRYR